MSKALLHGRRVLLVEDNGAQARQFGNLLRKAGAEIVGPAKSLSTAARLINSHHPAVAWLDVSLDDDIKVWPLAELLDSLGIPFVFCTSAPDEIEPARWPGRPIVSKPLRTQQAQDEMLTILATLVKDTPHSHSSNT